VISKAAHVVLDFLVEMPHDLTEHPLHVTRFEAYRQHLVDEILETEKIPCEVKHEREPRNRGFVTYMRTTEPFRLRFTLTSDGSFTRFVATDFIKTQPFNNAEVEPNIRIHMLICDFLCEIEAKGLAHIEVTDEGNYLPSKSFEQLFQRFSLNYTMIRNFSEWLKRSGWGNSMGTRRPGTAITEA